MYGKDQGLGIPREGMVGVGGVLKTPRRWVPCRPAWVGRKGEGGLSSSVANTNPCPGTWQLTGGCEASSVCIKGTCGNPLPVKGESLRKPPGFWRVPSEMPATDKHNPQLTERTRRDLPSRLSLHWGPAPWEGQAGSQHRDPPSSRHPWQCQGPGRWLVVSTPVWPRGPATVPPAQGGGDGCFSTVHV